MRLGKVYHDLNKSDYEYEFKNFKFIFSSKFYIEKFKSEIYNYISINSKKISEKYLKVECEEFLALCLYNQIEKRGFRVYYREKEINKNTLFKIIIKD